MCYIFLKRASLILAKVRLYVPNYLFHFLVLSFSHLDIHYSFSGYFIIFDDYQMASFDIYKSRAKVSAHCGRCPLAPRELANDCSKAVILVWFLLYVFLEWVFQCCFAFYC